MAGSAPESEDAITGINVIPLVDIVLVLLIIFMMTASFIVAPAVKVQLPQMSKAEEPPPRSLHFVVDAGGGIFLNDKTVPAEQLMAVVQKEVAANPEVQVLVSADRGVPYGEVVRLLDLVRTGGVKKFAISVQTAGS
ncbi:MAG: biopolymer transport protein TolR [Candidatus Binatota bacterium]|nr:biopolymer transport protein TolR [Candidatus Binatota bacterium]